MRLLIRLTGDFGKWDVPGRIMSTAGRLRGFVGGWGRVPFLGLFEHFLGCLAFASSLTKSNDPDVQERGEHRQKGEAEHH